VTAAKIFLRRWQLYAAACGAVFVLEGLFVHFVPVRSPEIYAGFLGPPLVNAFVLMNVGSDAAGVLPRLSQRCERFVERLWAVIIVDVMISVVQASGFFGLASADLGDKVLGALVMILSAMLIYAEPFVCMENSIQTLTLIPFSLLRSMTLAWVNMQRVFSLFALQMIVFAGLYGLLALLAAAQIAKTTLWELLYVTVTEAPLYALFAVAYLDTLAQERAALR
jgi:hypothetical protein